MNLICPQCSARGSYVTDIDGRHIKSGFILVFTYKCEDCHFEWVQEREAYITE